MKRHRHIGYERKGGGGTGIVIRNYRGSQNRYSAGLLLVDRELGREIAMGLGHTCTHTRTAGGGSEYARAAQYERCKT